MYLSSSSLPLWDSFSRLMRDVPPLAGKRRLRSTSISPDAYSYFFFLLFFSLLVWIRRRSSRFWDIFASPVLFLPSTLSPPRAESRTNLYSQWSRSFYQAESSRLRPPLPPPTILSCVFFSFPCELSPLLSPLRSKTFSFFRSKARLGFQPVPRLLMPACGEYAALLSTGPGPCRVDV